jgi:hypothetical protein
VRRAWGDLSAEAKRANAEAQSVKLQKTYG